MGFQLSSLRTSTGTQLTHKESTEEFEEKDRGKPRMRDGKPGYVTSRGKYHQFSHTFPTMLNVDDIDPWIENNGKKYMYKLVRVNKTFSQEEADAEGISNCTRTTKNRERIQSRRWGESKSREEVELELDCEELYRADAVSAFDMSNASSARRPMFTKNVVTERVIPLSVKEDSRRGVGKVTKALPKNIIITETHTWSLFNDSLNRFFFVRAIFDASSDIKGLTRTIVRRGVVDEIDRSQSSSSYHRRDTYYNSLWVAEVVVKPMETVSFIEGKVKGAYTLQCTDVRHLCDDTLFRHGRPPAPPRQGQRPAPAYRRKSDKETGNPLDLINSAQNSGQYGPSEECEVDKDPNPVVVVHDQDSDDNSKRPSDIDTDPPSPRATRAKKPKKGNIVKVVKGKKAKTIRR
ncbi:hypothetical protein AGDE_16062 [Angomonas deanei]|uniref:DUF1935 domain-containing protein n=1 Tax=Angomonas deanei TaxID=59799 RepID=A0A7G2CAX5_9TRYP|nr:hypothetical protein AGDE_16062 [Angomonas deanei]CAD2215182.1 Domain of unknown function (DUF1935), putative [Angomonas deanei]|eukprot:EPY17798.1 hypothetical protein AGDE_16062 [Angomonas deanei]